MSGAAPAERVLVIGAGTMGHGIAYAALAAGHAAVLVDTSEETLAAARRRIAESFEKAIARGKSTPDARDAALGRLTTAQAIEEGASGATIVVEAVPERLDLKRALLARAERVVAADALVATNTSSLSVTEIAEPLAAPERALGMHFFNPVAAMRLVEIVRGARTSEDAVRRARSFAESLGKTAIVVRDAPGFASSRLGVVLGLEAMRMLEQEVASAEDIDRAMELGYNHPVGPLRLTDLVGLDVRLAVADHLHATLGGDTYRAPDVLRRKVAEGKLGRKTGEGFYRWEAE